MVHWRLFDTLKGVKIKSSDCVEVVLPVEPAKYKYIVIDKYHTVIGAGSFSGKILVLCSYVDPLVSSRVVGFDRISW